MKIWAVRTLVVLGFGLGLLQIYSAYHNEQKLALAIAVQASEMAKAEELEVAEIEAREACSSAWLTYNLEEAKAKGILVRKGRAAYEAEEARISGHKPSCSKLDTTPSGAAQDSTDKLAHEAMARADRVLANLERRYASDRKLQTRHILRGVWSMLMGGARETPQQWAEYLAESYPDIIKNR
jgi:hypothetical protein